MASKEKKAFYTWYDADGSVNIYTDWDECKAHTNGRNVLPRRFSTRAEAEYFAKTNKEMPQEMKLRKEENDFEPRPNELAHWVSEPVDKTISGIAAVPEDAGSVRLDMSRVIKEPLGNEVVQYCEKYGFGNLSDDQKRAVQADKGKYLLFAVPGSGKTTVLMARTGYLVHALHVPAEEIKTMTFTRAAAQEMRDRYEKHFPADIYGNPPEFCTIHSFCLSLARGPLKKRDTNVRKML